MKVIIRLFIFLLPFILFSKSGIVFASEKFLTDYQVNYKVRPDGLTDAEMKVTLTNTASDYYYASSYKIELGFEHLSNIKASDLGGVISPQIEKTDKGYTIEFEFNRKVVGLGNKQQFNLIFVTPDIAEQVGKIWEINIPGIDDAASFNTFTVDLSVPESFGEPAFIKPAQKGPGYRFTKDQLVKSAISLAFGAQQQYAFTLFYHLQNRNLFPIRTEIALPPSTNYQDVSIESIIPEPVQVRKDLDGNWLAEYELNSAQQFEVKVKGRAIIYFKPRRELLGKSDMALYLEEKPYWEYADPEIKQLSLNLRTPQAIYNYVVSALDYDFTRVTNSSNRLGASGVLKKPKSAVCLEFTDLFIALARAAGIPAREVDGFAYTKNPRLRPLSLVQDILHAWPEYYDIEKQTWIMVDPTWGNTTNGVDYFNILDFDHFAFVKKGEDSTYPIPAGGYKLPGEEDRKDVFVWATKDEYFKTNKLNLDSGLKNRYLAGFPIEGKITIVNRGPGLSTGEKVVIKTENLRPQTQEIEVGELLPFAKKEIKFHLEKEPFLTNKSDTITMRLAGETYKKNIQIVPVYIENWKILGGTAGVIFSSIILIIAFKTRRLRIS